MCNCSGNSGLGFARRSSTPAPPRSRWAVFTFEGEQVSGKFTTPEGAEDKLTRLCRQQDGECTLIVDAVPV